MPVGVAFDGSPWVTAASSVGLVVVSFGLAVAGGAVIARRLASGELDVPSLGAPSAASMQRRSLPLEKSNDERQPTEMPPPVESLDDAAK